MTDEEDASPLRTRADVPPEMLRALRALKAEGPSRASLDQAALRLGNLLDAPAPAAPSVGWLLRSVGARAVVFRVGMAVLAIGATAAWLRPSEHERGLARTSPAAASKSDPTLAADDSTRSLTSGPRVSTSGPEASPEASDTAGGARASGSTTDGESAHAQRDGSGARAHRTRGRPARGSAPGTAALSAQTGLSRAPSAAGDSDGSSVAKQRAETAADKPDAAVSPALEPPPEPASASKRSEVELLLEARRLAVRDPKGAQRLLEQHAVRFPDGVLSPEREVLAIEVLRALGQTAAAEQRLRAFRARYPNSMHLRRLSSPPASQAH
jgi:hypothetical protein